MHLDHGLHQRGVHPHQRRGVVGVIHVAAFERTYVFVDLAVDSRVHGVHTLGRPKCCVQVAVDHGEYVGERALKPALHIRARRRVLIDREGYVGVGDLQQRGPQAADEHDTLSLQLPGGAVRPMDPGGRIASAGSHELQ